VKCSRKHNGVCIWCFQHSPDRYVKINKATTIVMILMPAFMLLIPAPVPAVMLIVSNPFIIFPMAIYTGAAYIILGIMKATAAKKMVALIPVDAESLDERKLTAAEAQAKNLVSHLAVGTSIEQSSSVTGPESSVTCKNCDNVFKRAPGANICPACGFTYDD
jgi:hypothetical protein